MSEYPTDEVEALDGLVTASLFFEERGDDVASYEAGKLYQRAGRHVVGDEPENGSDIAVPNPIDEYQAFTEQTAIGHATSETEGVSQTDAVVFLSLALNGEAGEVAEKAKRVVRGDGDLDAVGDELGDVLWYLFRIADELDISMADIIDENVAKLEDRKERGVIAGSGDNR